MQPTTDREALEYLVLSELLQVGRQGLTVPEFQKRLPGSEATRCLFDLADDGKVERLKDRETRIPTFREHRTVYVLPTRIIESHQANLAQYKRGMTMPPWLSTLLKSTQSGVLLVGWWIYNYRALAAASAALGIAVLRYYTTGLGSVLITTAEFACGMVVMHGIDDVKK